jgi:predicted RecA/RadA family phage recombinase
MAFESPLHLFTFEAAVDLSTKQFHAVTLNSAGKLILPAADGDDAIGILQNKPTAGQEGSVMLSGISMVAMTGAVAIADQVQVLTTGRGDTAASGDHVIGQCLETAALAGDIVAVKLGSNHLLA